VDGRESPSEFLAAMVDKRLDALLHALQGEHMHYERYQVVGEVRAFNLGRSQPINESPTVTWWFDAFASSSIPPLVSLLLPSSAINLRSTHDEDHAAAAIDLKPCSTVHVNVICGCMASVSLHIVYYG
jgi:hypothetical protein